MLERAVVAAGVVRWTGLFGGAAVVAAIGILEGRVS